MNTRQTKDTYVPIHNSYVPTFITKCQCGCENEWMTTGVMINSMVCKNCNKTSAIDWGSIERFETKYDHDYQIEIKFEDATMRKKSHNQNTGVTTIFPSFPSICKLSIRSKENYIFNFESIGFNFGCLGFLTKPDIINWFENTQNIDFFKSGYEVDYNKFIKFKLASMEYSIYE